MATIPHSPFKDHHSIYPAIDVRQELKDASKGKVVFVAGGAKGIGKQTAFAYARSGSTGLVITSRTLEQVKSVASEIEKECPHCQVLPFELDVTDQGQVEKLFAQVLATFGRLDVLINNAGRLENWMPISESDPLEWWATMETNIKGSYLTVREALKIMKAQEPRGGFIINTSSMGALRTRPGASAYQMSKFAINRLTEFIAKEYDGFDILTHAIHPGGVPTELALNMPKDMHAVLIDDESISGGLCVWLTKTKRNFLQGRFLSATWDVDEVEKAKDKILAGDLLKFHFKVDGL